MPALPAEAGPGIGLEVSFDALDERSGPGACSALRLGRWPLYIRS